MTSKCQTNAKLGLLKSQCSTHFHYIVLHLWRLFDCEDENNNINKALFCLLRTWNQYFCGSKKESRYAFNLFLLQICIRIQTVIYIDNDTLMGQKQVTNLASCCKCQLKTNIFTMLHIELIISYIKRKGGRRMRGK